MNQIFAKILTFIKKYAKIIFPALILVLAAITVAIALNARNRAEAPAVIEPEEIVVPTSEEGETEPEDTDIPLTENAESAIEELFRQYYQCLSDGDMDTIQTLCDLMEEKKLLQMEEQAQYLSYNVVEIYTQQGPVENSFIVYVYCQVTFDAYPETPLPDYRGFYVCMNENGSYYIVNGELTEEENAYISRVASQDDVVELNNRVTVEYNEAVLEHPELLEYLSEMDTLVNTAVGEKLAAMNASEEAPVENEEGTETEVTEETPVTEEPVAEEPVVQEPQYATTTTTVNVRASDSEKADKLGKVSGGTKLEVVEVLVNGWTKVIYNNAEGFIKSSYLSLVQSADSVETAGTVTTTSTVNVRSAADTGADRLGVLPEGEKVEYVKHENGWYQIKYNGQIAYIIEDYVTEN
jgi:uncharacterized protein YgiM (DUF1202 family)